MRARGAAVPISVLEAMRIEDWRIRFQYAGGTAEETDALLALARATVDDARRWAMLERAWERVMLEGRPAVLSVG